MKIGGPKLQLSLKKVFSRIHRFVIIKKGRIVEPKLVLNNDSQVLMITMYERTIGYDNVRSSMQDHIIKF
jgi:hypothetical protein